MNWLAWCTEKDSPFLKPCSITLRPEPTRLFSSLSFFLCFFSSTLSRTIVLAVLTLQFALHFELSRRGRLYDQVILNYPGISYAPRYLRGRTLLFLQQVKLCNELLTCSRIIDPWSVFLVLSIFLARDNILAGLTGISLNLRTLGRRESRLTRRLDAFYS